MTDLLIGGETFNVLIEGDATLPVVMLSHALGADLHLWDDQMTVLRDRFRVVRYDTRGHGGSIASAAPYAVAQLGRDALAIMDALEIDKVHWIGLSKGGVIGQWLLRHATDRIERAILANTAAQFGDADSWNSRIVTAKHHGLSKLGAGTMSRWFGDGFSQRDPERIASVNKTFLATSVEGYAGACAALRDVDLREDLRRIDHPVLVITGHEDESIAPAQTADIMRGLANARLVTLAARHLSNIEAAEDFNTAIIAFLTAKTVRPPRRKTATPRLPTARRPAGRRSPATRGVPAEAPTRRLPIRSAKSGIKPVPVAKTTPAKAVAATPKRKAGVAAPAKPKTTQEKAKTAVGRSAAKTVAKPAQASGRAPAARLAKAGPKTGMQAIAKPPTKPAIKATMAAKASGKNKTPPHKTPPAKTPPARTVVKTPAKSARPAVKAAALKATTKPKPPAALKKADTPATKRRGGETVANTTGRTTRRRK